MKPYNPPMQFGDPPTPLLVLWVLWVAQAAWSCLNIWLFRNRAARLKRRIERRNVKLGPFTPPAVVIVPVKGADPHFAEHVHALTRQDYPSYRMIFVVESERDPAHAALQGLRADVAHEMDVLVAGRADRGGQKVHNQLCGLRSLRDSDEVIVFADADAVPHDRWLSYLVEPLRRERIGATTGYRWFVPTSDVANKDPRETRNEKRETSPSLASLLVSVLNASIATLLGPPRRNHAWGGSMAITRRMARDAELLEHWDGALSDDYQLSRAVRAAGKVIVFLPQCLVVSPARFTWRSMLEFGRRQYVITRVHAPLLWVAALVVTALYTAGWLSVLVAAMFQTPGWPWGFAAWAVVYALDLLRAAQRRRAVGNLLGEAVAQQLRPVWRLERWATPLWLGLHLFIVLTSAFGRRITWAGITYDMRARQDVRILRKNATSES